MNFDFNILERIKIQNELASVWAQMTARADTITDPKLKAQIEKKVEILMRVDTYLCYIEQELHSERKRANKAQYDASVFKLSSMQATKELEQLKSNIHENL